MGVQPEITQRDLRSRSREITDAIQSGQSVTVTRDGHPIGRLVPLRRRRRFVSRQEFAAMSRTAPSIDLDRFRADQEATADTHPDGPYDRWPLDVPAGHPRHQHHDSASLGGP
nr:prevent-host-death protein [Streptomyces fradiae]